MFAVSLLSYWRNLTPRKQRVKTGYKTNPYTSHNFPLHPLFRDSPDTKEIVENCGAGSSRSRMQTINETFESQDPMRRKKRVQRSNLGKTSVPRIPRCGIPRNCWKKTKRRDKLIWKHHLQQQIRTLSHYQTSCSERRRWRARGRRRRARGRRRPKLPVAKSLHLLHCILH